ncbi:MAG: PorV/PorQ family protein [candidate division Zixibacteria bacterium]|nr:PorV/PorQ family protein [candidate division Zixibacteria bacterium]
MKTSKISYLLTALALILCILVTSAAAKDINTRVGTSSFSFLKINVGARAVGMGGAFTGLADDESALYYNPSGIASLEGRRFIAGYHNYFVDLQSGFVGYIQQLSERQFIAGYINYLNYGDFIKTDELGNVDPNGTFGGGDLLMAATFAVKYNDQFMFGVSGKFIYEKLESYSATGAALDLGGKYTSDRGRYQAGVAIQNLGFQFSALGEEKNDLPLTVRGGLAVKPKEIPVMFTGDLIIPIDNNPIYAIGGEYLDFKPFYIRMGWNSFGSNYRTADSDDKWAGMSFGVGFDHKELHLSYAFSPGAELGESHRITLTGGF